MRVHDLINLDIIWISSSNMDQPLMLDLPAFDLEGAFDDIISNVQSGQYQNEYDFQSDLYLTFTKAKDGHFVSMYPLQDCVIGLTSCL